MIQEIQYSGFFSRKAKVLILAFLKLFMVASTAFILYLEKAVLVSIDFFKEKTNNEKLIVNI